MKKKISIISLLIFTFYLPGCGLKFISDSSENKNIQPEISEEPAVTAAGSQTATNFTRYEENFENDGGEIMLSFSTDRVSVDIVNNTAAAESIYASLKSRYDIFYSETGGYLSSAIEMFSQIEPED